MVTFFTLHSRLAGSSSSTSTWSFPPVPTVFSSRRAILSAAALIIKFFIFLEISNDVFVIHQFWNTPLFKTSTINEKNNIFHINYNRLSNKYFWRTRKIIIISFVLKNKAVCLYINNTMRLNCDNRVYLTKGRKSLERVRSEQLSPLPYTRLIGLNLPLFPLEIKFSTNCRERRIYGTPSRWIIVFSGTDRCIFFVIVVVNYEA